MGGRGDKLVTGNDQTHQVGELCSPLFRVSDDGPGVPAHERTRIFDRFARGEGGDTRQGSGLGLAIVKGFADAMGMSVTIDDAPGGGACFTLVLPQAGRAGP